jgi:cytochrome P450
MMGVSPGFERPPGPKTRNPLLGVLSEFRKDPPAFLLRNARQYGDLVYLPLARQKAYLVNRPEWIRDILVTHQANFLKSRVLERAKRLLGQGLLTSEGEFHTHQRRLVQPAFHRDRMAHYGSEMVACAARAREQWLPGAQLDLAREMPHLTLAIVGRTLFSADVSSDAEGIGQAMTTILNLFDTLMMPFADWLQKLPLPAVRRFENSRAVLDKVIYDLIAQRRASGRDEGDLLSMLLLARDEDRNGMTDTQVRDEALTLLIAGHETTANALIWSWYLLSQNPEAEAKLHAELDEVLAGRLPQFDDAPKLAYTTGVISEALRLFPPAWAIGRRAKEEYSIGAYRIPARSILLLSPWVSHRDPRWFPDPEKFDPDRWRPEIAETLPKFAYYPFGGGARVCIGERFAWTEAVLVLATLAQRWKMRLVSGQQIATKAVITLRPRYGMNMIAEPVASWSGPQPAANVLA